MSTLTLLKNKIRSIQTTQKITHAVRLISMSFYSKLEKQNVYLQDYTINISQLFSQLLAFVPEWKNPIIFPDDILDTNPLFIVISAAKGLCGSFNSNLFRYFERAFFVEEHQKPIFITIGQKATKLIKEKKAGEIILSVDEITSSNFVPFADKIVEIINDRKNIYSSVSIYSNHFKNFFTQKPQKTTLIPVSIKQPMQVAEIEFIWEQSQDAILDYLAAKYIKSSILNLLFQSLISENAARFIAMDSSTTNAEKILEKLTLQFNKTRQTLITREVSELAANF